MLSPSTVAASRVALWVKESLWCSPSLMALTKFGAAHPMAAERAVITARAATAPTNTVNRGFFIAMIYDGKMWWEFL